MKFSTEALGNHGERMTADAFNWSYFAHLSIYAFADRLVPEKKVLDAGCGTGYGTIRLMESAASVTAWEGDALAVEYCRGKYRDSGVVFDQVDLCRPFPAENGQFEVIFSSNVMEHLAEIDDFLSECARTLAPDGVLVAAVPPICNKAELEVNIRNVYHVTNLTPAAWHAKLQRFFEDVSCHTHLPIGRWREPGAVAAELQRAPQDVTVRETDFCFDPVEVADLNRGPTITAVFLARRPRTVALPFSMAEVTPPEWHEGAIAASVLREKDEDIRGLWAEILRLRGEHGVARAAGQPSDGQMPRRRKTLADRLKALVQHAPWQRRHTRKRR